MQCEHKAGIIESKGIFQFSASLSTVNCNVNVMFFIDKGSSYCGWDEYETIFYVLFSRLFWRRQTGWEIKLMNGTTVFTFYWKNLELYVNLVNSVQNINFSLYTSKYSQSTNFSIEISTIADSLQGTLWLRETESSPFPLKNTLALIL